MKINAKSKGSAKIPTCSMADIIFLLFIFFMSVTVFRQFIGLRVQLPVAKATKKIEAKRMIVHIWVDSKNNINIDDMIFPLEQVEPIIAQKLQENPAIIISIQADSYAKYGTVAQILEKLKLANALRVNFATMTES